MDTEAKAIGHGLARKAQWMSDTTRNLLEHAMFFHPMPFVRRVIFLATPHHGSYIAGSWFAHQAARLIRAPLGLTKGVTGLATGDTSAFELRISGCRRASTT